MEGITAIIFDLGGVLLNINYNKTKVAFENIGVENFHAMYSQADADALFQDLETGRINETDFYNSVKKFVGDEISDENIRNAWNAMLLDFRKSSLAELKSLRKKYRLFLLSNTNFIHLQAFNKIYKESVDDVPFEDLFDKVYFSHEIGLRKPDVDPFLMVIKENNLIPANTLFIDDSLQNVEGARKAGLRAIHFIEGMRVENLGL